MFGILSQRQTLFSLLYPLFNHLIDSGDDDNLESVACWRSVMGHMDWQLGTKGYIAARSMITCFLAYNAACKVSNHQLLIRLRSMWQKRSITVSHIVTHAGCCTMDLQQ